MRTLILMFVVGVVVVLAALLTGWSLEDAGVHLPGEGPQRGPISSPTAAYPR